MTMYVAWALYRMMCTLNSSPAAVTLQVLMKGSTPSQARDLISSYETLTSPEKMGHRFKFFSISHHPDHIPVPFFNDVKIMDE